jgi:Apoptosis antagonizing transcription factor
VKCGTRSLLTLTEKMFAEAGDDREDKQQSASAAATDQVKLWETIIGLRISLQRSIDTSNKLPNADFISHTVRNDQSGANQLAEVKDGLKGLVGDLNHLLEIQTEGSSSTKKRKVNEEIKWDDIAKIQQKLRPSWESTVNKWHARLHFGSEQMKSKMKVFNQTIWEQVSLLLESF